MPGNELKSLTIPIVILLMIITISTVYFHLVEGWSFLDAAYYTAVTVTTVGYGDFVPKSNLGKIGTIILIFSGVSTAFYIITHVGLLRERTIDPQVQRRLEILRNLTSLQTGTVEKSQLKAIKEKIQSKGKPDTKGDDRNRGFGSL